MWILNPTLGRAGVYQPGGMTFTVITSMLSSLGTCKKGWGGRQTTFVFSLSAKALRRAHEVEGLEILRCEYFVSCFLEFSI
jgi:hypothetical protein